MKHIYLILMHSGTLPATLVRAVTGYPYSHAGLSLSPDCDPFYSFGRRSLYCFLNGGFVCQRGADPFFRRFSNTHCRILALPVTGDQHARLLALLDAFSGEPERYRYDFMGAVLRALLHRPISFRNRYVCSQFVAELLERADIHHFGKPACMAVPADLAAIPGARERYVGPYPVRFPVSEAAPPP